jgi:hypothetical protein
MGGLKRANGEWQVEAEFSAEFAIPYSPLAIRRPATVSQ